MKKWLKTGKKALSVIMAIMMLMSAWVWVAPTEAEAANGTYYYKLVIQVTDTADGWDTNNVKLYYRTNNGRTSSTSSTAIGITTDNWNSEKTYTFEDSLSGFPCGYTHEYSFGGGFTWRSLGYTVTLSVGSSKSSYTQIFSTSYSAESSAFSAAKGTFGSATSVGADKYPYVSTSKSISAGTAVADIGIPPLGDKKDTSISERSIQYYTTDQYGVRYEPTSYTVSGVTGLTAGTGWSMGSAYKISATTSTTKSTTYTHQTATVKLNWKNSNSNQTQHADSSYTFKVYNPRYKFTFDGNGGTLGTNYTYAYHGRTLGDSTSTATSNNVSGLASEKVPTAGIREGYTFNGIYTSASGGSQITSSTTPNVTADTTYYAHWDVNKYTATFYGTKANEAGTETVEYVVGTSSVDYNTNPVAPSTVEGYSLGDYDYTFKGWDKEISPIGVNGAEYRATYTSAFVPADYDAVDDIVDEANDIINSANYESIYSEESRHALENAVNSVIYNQGRTSQAVVDAYVPMIREAIDGLGRQKYSVLFIDGVDNSVISMSYPVYYGDPVKFPADPVRGFTTTDHYVFKGWESSESGDDITFVSKNMVILANFDKVAHTFTDTLLSSNCTTQSGVLHKCSCGYEYVEYSGSVGTEHDLDSEFTVDIAPTCTTVGSKSRHCSRCTYRADVTEIPALGHDYTDGYQGVVINPGCENNGAEVSECQRCGYDKYSIVPASGHNWSEEVIAPTCISSGYTVKTCTNCHDEDIVSFVDPIAHTYVEDTDEYIAPTCTGLGKKVSYCSCGAQKVETVESTGHIWDTELTTDYDATCTTKGQQSIHCSVCDVINSESITEIPENGHTWGAEVCEQKESCGIKGIYIKTCEVCSVNSTRITDALTHKYNTETIPATCTDAGKKTTVCENCGDISGVEIIQPTGHSYKKEGAIVDVEATCTAPAYKIYTCDTCGDKNTVYTIGSNALLHDFNGTETIIDNATCTADGKKTVKCTRCDATTEVIIPRLGHSYGEWDKTTNPATNDKDGTWTRTCENCGDVETLTIPKGGHNLVEDTSKYVAPKCNTKGQRVYKCDAHENCTVTVTVELDYAQHTVAQKVTDATCTAPGSVEAYCSVCGTSFKTTETPVKAHNFEAQTPVAPTCTTSGYTPYKCANCDASYNMYTGAEATGHSYEASTTPATCTATGSTTYTCACGDTYTETIPATGHNYVKGTVTAADCTTAGTEVYTCDNPNCGDTYTKFIEAARGHSFTNWETVTAATADKYGVRKGTCACGDVEYELIAPIGNHTFEEKITRNATCTEKGEKAFTCTAHTNCTANYTEEIPATGHTQKISYTAPTCSTAGSSKVVCSVCYAEILSETIPATGIHDFSGAGVKADATCTQTGTLTYTCATEGCTATKTEVIPAKGHDLTTTVTDAKCGEKGSVVITCSRCDDPAVEKTYELGAKGHIWGEYTVEKDATCTEDGKKVASCTNADCTEKNEIVIPKSGHSWSKWAKTDATTTADGKWERSCSTCRIVEALAIPRGHSLVKDTANSKAATCSAEGKEIYICEAHTDCGVKIELTLPKLQHTVAQREIEATCTKEGSVEAYCSVCKAVLSTEEIPVKAHAYAAGTPVAPTCTTSGYTPYKCSCGDTYNEYDESKPATGHTLVEGASTASCLNGGQMTLTCSKAGCTYNATVNVPALGHNYVAGATTAATCKTPATQTYNCSRCTDSYTVFTGAKTTEHTWGGWSVKESATPTSLGYQTAECTVCGQIKVETIPATGDHKFDDEVSRSDATCTTDGLVTYKCSAHTDCGLTSTVTIPATGHTEELQYQAATCEAAGYARRYCTTCKTVLETQEIPAIGHAWNDGTVTGANCVTDGKIEYSCTRTGCTETKTTVIPKDYISHDYVTTTTQPTCYKEGSIVVKCSREGCISNPVNEKLAKLEHSWDGGAYANEADKPTCEADGTMTYSCTAENCTASKTETIPANGHTWSTWTVTPSTNDAPGSVSRECTVCHKPESVEIPAGGHKLVVDTANSTDASCTAEGTLVYKCENHTDCGITVTVTVPKLQHELEKTEKFATCTDAGEVVTKCKNCNTATFTTIIPATGHNYSSEVTTPATCTSEGVRTYTCAHDAKHTYTEPVAKLPHNYVAGENVPATCTTSGYTPYKCATCDSNYVLITANAKGHDFDETVEANVTVVSATCQTEGSKTVRCKDCTATNTVKLPKSGHSYIKKGETASATCAVPATEVYECEFCGDAYTKYVSDKLTTHNDWTGWTEVKATDNSLGYRTRKCNTCGQVEFEIIPATGEHNFSIETAYKKAPTCTDDGYIVYACSAAHNCGLTSKVKVPATGHKETISYKAPTCTENGYTKIVCSVDGCNYEKDEKIIPAPGHIYGNGEITVKATCNKAGNIKYTCSCGDVMNVEIPKDTTAHKLNTKVDLATCKAEGKVTVICENGCDYKQETTIPKLQHNWGGWEKTDATNSTPGQWKRTCSNGCVETVEIPAGGHKFGDTPVSTTAGTCKEQGTATYSCTAHTNCGVTITVKNGYAEHTYKTDVVESCSKAGSVKTYCTVCEKPFAEISLSKAQHTYDEGVETAPTCTSSGYTLYTCEKCGHTYKEIGAEAKGHTLVEGTSTATCTAGGKMTLTCDCGYSTTVAVPALGHDYGKLSSTDATCAAAATETYKCSRCDANYTISVGEKTDAHKYPDVWTEVVAPKEASIGYSTRACETCGKLEIKTLDATGEHKFADGQLVEDGAKKAATCTENGYETRKCSVHSDCGKTALVTIPATGHKEIAIEAVAATCEKEGSTAGTKCETCDTTLLAPVTLPKLGHAWGNEKVTPATCKAEGKIAYTCTRGGCNATHSVVIEIDENAHKYDTTVKSATCTVDGEVTTKCSLCGDTKTTSIPAKGHVWSETASSTTAASCEGTGSATYKCKNCTAENTVIVPALGHVYEAGEKVAATCTTSGYTVYTCKNDANHTYKVYDENAKAKGHTWGEWTVVTDATETTEGLKERKCTVVGCDGQEQEVIPAMMHEMTVLENVPATCKSAGHITYKCNVKHDEVECDYTLTVDLPKIAHTLSTTVIEASCTKAGSVVTECTVDGCDYKLEEALAVKPHTISVSYAYPSCTVDGYVKEECDVCDYEQTISTTAALGHDYCGTETVEKDASCLESGSKTVKCSRCDATTTVEIPAKGHSYKASEAEEATCTTSGYIPYTCTCGAGYKELTSEPNGHKWKTTPESERAATCSAPGEKVYKCENCDATNKVVTAQLTHSFVWTLEEAPTTTSEGLLVGRCAYDKCTEKVEVKIPAINSGDITCKVTFLVNGEVVAVHTVAYGGGTTAPEITNKAPDASGHYSYTWDKNFDKVFGNIEVNAVFNPETHKFGNWETVTPAACNKTGTQRRVCTVCGYEELGSIETSDHNYVVKEHKDATCTENGYDDLVCKDCGETSKQVIRSLGHVMSYHEYVDATCTEEGSLAYYSCSRCGNNYADRAGKQQLSSVVISAKLHTIVLVKGKDATCTENGATDYYYCTACGLTQESKVILAYGHEDTNGDNVCDRCDGTYYEGGEQVCTCTCHKPGVLNELIFKIINFFWKLFGKNKSCDCGKLHY